MSAREWQAGDKAYVEVEVTTVLDGLPLAAVKTDRSGTTVRIESLLPVPAAGEAATEDVIERAARVLAETVAPWDETPSIVRDSLTAQARALAAAGLLAGGVPGRSEAEIKADALKTGDVADMTLTLEVGDEEEDWIAVGPAGDAWPDVDGWWIPRAMIRRATDPLAARVAGTTEAGDDRG